MALSGKQYYITRAGLVNSRADGLAAVADAHHGRRFVPETIHDLVDDGLGLLGAGIVARDDAEVGVVRRDRAHDRPLEPVAVAAAAEEHDQASPCDGAQRP